MRIKFFALMKPSSCTCFVMNKEGGGRSRSTQGRAHVVTGSFRENENAVSILRFHCAVLLFAHLIVRLCWNICMPQFPSKYFKQWVVNTILVLFRGYFESYYYFISLSSYNISQNINYINLPQKWSPYIACSDAPYWMKPIHSGQSRNYTTLKNLYSKGKGGLRDL